MEKSRCIKLNVKKNTNYDYVFSIILAEIDLLQQLIQRLECELGQMPEGKISRKFINNKQYLYHYYKTLDGSYHQKFMGKSDSCLAEKLKRKVFLLKSLPTLKRNYNALNMCAIRYKPYFSSDVVNGLILPLEKQIDCCFEKNDIIKAWLAEDFERNELFPDALIHTSAGGLKVRSKSEAIIAGLLENKEIPFRYEAKLEIGGKNYYPDFTILKPKDGKILYWEHFGMVQNPNYNQSMEQKLTVFLRNGLIPWENYVATYDSHNGSINASLIQSIIHAFIIDL